MSMGLWYMCQQVQGPYSKHFIFFMTYELVQKARVLHCIRLEMLVRGKHWKIWSVVNTNPESHSVIYIFFPICNLSTHLFFWWFLVKICHCWSVFPPSNENVKGPWEMILFSLPNTLRNFPKIRTTIKNVSGSCKNWFHSFKTSTFLRFYLEDEKLNILSQILGHLQNNLTQSEKAVDVKIM